MASNPHQHNQLLTLFAAYAKRLDKLYDDFVTRLIASLPLSEDEVWQKLADNPLFLFDDLPYLKARLQHIFDDYVNKQVLCYKAGITDGVALAFSQDKINLGKYTILQDEAIKAARNAAVASFIANRMSRKEGLSLSDKVWNYSQLGKSEVEMGISNVIKDGLKAGTSAEELGRKVRQYLNNPTMMYRRYWVNVATAGGGKKKVARWYRRHIDKKTGKVTFKDEPLEKVGVGTYRSARMNAKRLMRTEINMSYHKANASRWANEPFVYGIRVWKSPQHPRPDICDDLEGYYPRNFVFSGWHPQCYKDGTKVLTACGWKLIQEVAITDEVCSLNPDTLKIEYVGIVDRQAWHKKGMMYHFVGKGLDCVVTPEHRMVYLNRSGNIQYCKAEKFTNRKGAFILSLFGTSALCEAFKVYPSPYVGMVYDLTLEKNHIMYVSYNGTCFWGSNCMCASAPLTLYGDEKRDFYRRLMKGEDMSNFHSKYEITEANMNPKWKQYIQDQHDSILRAGERGKLAYHLRDNQQYWVSQFSKDEQKRMGLLKDDKARIKAIADARHAARTPEQAKEIADRWHEHKRVDALVRKGMAFADELREYPFAGRTTALDDAIRMRDAAGIEKILGDKILAKRLTYEKSITPKELMWSEFRKNFISDESARWTLNTFGKVVRSARTEKDATAAIKVLRKGADERVWANLTPDERRPFNKLLWREEQRMHDWYDYQRYSKNLNMIKDLVDKNANVIGGAFKRLTVSASDFYLQDLEEMRKLVNDTYFQPFFNLRAWAENAAFVANSKSPIVHQLFDGILNAYRTQGFTADVEDMVDQLKANIDRLKKLAEKKAAKEVSPLMNAKLAKHGEYLGKDDNFVFDRDFFDMLKEKFEVKLPHTNKGSYEHLNGKEIVLDSDRRSAKSIYEKHSVVYHEGGHAIADQRKMYYHAELISLRERMIGKLEKKVKTTVWDDTWDKEAKKWITVPRETRESGFKIMDRRLREWHLKLMKMDAKTFAKHGITRDDALEALCSFADTIESLKPGYGWGHGKKYFSSQYLRRHEFLAHCFENTFIGNPLFRHFMPEEYKETIAMIKKWQKEIKAGKWIDPAMDFGSHD